MTIIRAEMILNNFLEFLYLINVNSILESFEGTTIVSDHQFLSKKKNCLFVVGQRNELFHDEKYIPQELRFKNLSPVDLNIFSFKINFTYVYILNSRKIYC